MSAPAYDLTHLVSGLDEEIQFTRQNGLELVDLFFAYVSAREAGKENVVLRPTYGERRGIIADLLGERTELSYEEAWKVAFSGFCGFTNTSKMYRELSKIVRTSPDLPENSETITYTKAFELFTRYAVTVNIIADYLEKNPTVRLNLPIDKNLANKFGSEEIIKKIESILINKEISDETTNQLKKIVKMGLRYDVAALGFFRYIKQIMGGK